MRYPIALEITEHWVKLVAAKHLVDQHLIYYAAKPLVSFFDENLIKIIADTLNELKLKPKSLTVSLPRNRVTVRNLHLPSQDPTEIAQMVDLNIVRLVPYRKEEVISNYQILGVDEVGYSKVILAIIHQDVAKKLLGILEAAGLFIDKILLSSYGVWEWTLFNYRDEISSNEICLLLDIDSDFADFIIFNRDNLLFTRSIAIKSENLAEQTALTKFIGEIKQSLVIFQSEESSKRLAKVFLSGAATNFSNLDRVVEKELEIPVKTVPSLHNVKGKVRAIDKGAPFNISLSAPAAFLLNKGGKRISFNLPEIEVRQGLKEKSKNFTILGSLVLYIFTLIYGMFWVRIYNRQIYLKKIEDYYKVVEKNIGDLPAKLKKIRLVRNYLEARKMPMVFLYELQKAAPKEIVIKFINVDAKGKVTLRGEALQLSNVFSFIGKLEDIKYFRDVQTKYTRKKKLKDKEITNFEIVFFLCSNCNQVGSS